MSDISPTPRRWFQFSLSNFLLAMAPLAGLCWLTTFPFKQRDDGQRLFLAISLVTITVGALFRGLKGMHLGFFIGMSIAVIGSIAVMFVLLSIEIILRLVG